MADVGRPSKYSKHYCDEVIACMSLGFSLTAFAGEIGVARSTINEWMEVHPEFSEAVKKGKAKRTLSLEKRLLTADSGPVVTSSIFALKNADPDEWREKQTQEHTGPNGGPMQQVTTVRLVPLLPKSGDE